MVSIKDIAAECGVSIATVSKALNNHRDVSENTRRLIREKAKEMGYLPNSQARALKTNRTYNLGVLFVEQSDSGLKQSYFASVLDGFKREAERNGYDITFISGNIGEQNMTYYEHCMYRNVDGVFVACVDDYHYDGLAELLKSSVPVVVIDYVPEGGGTAVISDNFNGMAELVSYIADCGHKKIAYIYGENSQVTTERLKGFRSASDSCNIKVRDDFLVQGCYHDPRKTEFLVKKLLSGPKEDRPTCIIVPDDFAALGAYNAVEELGMSVPDDISIAGYDGIVLSQALRPKLTTVRQDTDRLGAEAAGRLISLINKEVPEGGDTIVVRGELIKGASVRKIG